MPEENLPIHSTQKEEPVNLPQNPETFPTSAHPKARFLPKPIALIVIILIVGVLLSGLVFTVYTLGRNSVLKELNPTAPTVPPADPVIQTSPTPDLYTEDRSATADWKTYSDSDFGVSFKYPDSYGSIVKKPSPEGKLLTFSINKSIIFGAYIEPENESGGRGGTVLDLYKVTKENGKYYWTMWFNKNAKSEIKPIKIISSVDGTEILILNNDSFIETIGNEYKFLDGGTAAFINLKNDKYTSIVFRNSPFNDGEPAFPTPDPEFEQMLSTIKFTN